ncbi:hypothetical protein H9P43_002271 [Blastocladiella emersonii ATCC 22665]|nr:hypothetical protein H9P43_002271 [Blastocladiella emersonii ATCC 22665]
MARSKSGTSAASTTATESDLASSTHDFLAAPGSSASSSATSTGSSTSSASATALPSTRPTGTVTATGTATATSTSTVAQPPPTLQPYDPAADGLDPDDPVLRLAAVGRAACQNAFLCRPDPNSSKVCFQLGKGLAPLDTLNRSGIYLPINLSSYMMARVPQAYTAFRSLKASSPVLLASMLHNAGEPHSVVRNFAEFHRSVLDCSVATHRWGLAGVLADLVYHYRWESTNGNGPDACVAASLAWGAPGLALNTTSLKERLDSLRAAIADPGVCRATKDARVLAHRTWYLNRFDAMMHDPLVFSSDGRYDVPGALLDPDAAKDRCGYATTEAAAYMGCVPAVAAVGGASAVPPNLIEDSAATGSGVRSADGSDAAGTAVNLFNAPPAVIVGVVVSVLVAAGAIFYGLMTVYQTRRQSAIARKAMQERAAQQQRSVPRRQPGILPDAVASPVAAGPARPTRTASTRLTRAGVPLAPLAATSTGFGRGPGLVQRSPGSAAPVDWSTAADDDATDEILDDYMADATLARRPSGGGAAHL